MEPAYPNPTTDGAVVRFTLPSAMPVKLAVYGQTRKHGPHGAFLVHTLADRAFAAGVYQVVWDGNDDQGARLPPGLYRVALTVAGGSVCGDIEIR
jgi:flagellar hook assembly protein FlgD